MIDTPITVAFLVLAGCVWQRDQGRVRRLKACARQRNLRFSRYDWLDVHRQYRRLALMGIGHAPRAWHMLCGMRGQGLWIGFFDAFDAGGGSDRVSHVRCVSIAEAPLDGEAIWLPRRLADDGEHAALTRLAVLGYRRCAAPAGDGARVLFTRRPSTAGRPTILALQEAIGRYPADWLWEAGENAILACADGALAAETIGQLLDATASAVEAVGERAGRAGERRPAGL